MATVTVGMPVERTASTRRAWRRLDIRRQRGHDHGVGARPPPRARARDLRRVRLGVDAHVDDVAVVAPQRVGQGERLVSRGIGRREVARAAA